MTQILIPLIYQGSPFKNGAEESQWLDKRRAQVASGLTDLTLGLITERIASICVTDGTYDNKIVEGRAVPIRTEYWLPKSLIEYEFTGKKIDGFKEIEVALPEWLATEKGLV